MKQLLIVSLILISILYARGASVSLTPVDKVTLLSDIEGQGFINSFFYKKFVYPVNVVLIQSLFGKIASCSSIDDSGYIQLCDFELGTVADGLSTVTLATAIGYYVEKGYDMKYMHRDFYWPDGPFGVSRTFYPFDVILLIKGPYKASEQVMESIIPAKKKSNDDDDDDSSKKRTLPSLITNTKKNMEYDLLRVTVDFYKSGVTLNCYGVVGGKEFDCDLLTVYYTSTNKGAPPALLIADLLSNGWTLGDITPSISSNVASVFLFSRPTTSKKVFKKIPTDAATLGVTDINTASVKLDLISESNMARLITQEFENSGESS
eukprot:TRINITY_DN6330_c0_g1_i1.p1 TRINITY_DN6330_c0_g1~~TRINITY_DN6330_c0_g1_i1.p1  ORF type:complete len:320 (-),score=66.17 TRINITY_DN6330_c0_g1_i1:276-1235(-)